MSELIVAESNIVKGFLFPNVRTAHQAQLLGAWLNQHIYVPYYYEILQVKNLEDPDAVVGGIIVAMMHPLNNSSPFYATFPAFTVKGISPENSESLLLGCSLLALVEYRQSFHQPAPQSIHLWIPGNKDPESLITCRPGDLHYVSTNASDVQFLAVLQTVQAEVALPIRVELAAPVS